MNALKVVLGIIAALIFLWIFARFDELLQRIPAWPFLLIGAIVIGIYFGIHESKNK